MNITRLIREKAIIDFFASHFAYPEFHFPPLKAPPRTRNYAQVGQAFDYLLRFSLERKTGVRQSEWVADFAGNPAIPDNEEEEQEQQKALYLLEKAHRAHERYLHDGVITYGLLKACLDLALLDKVLREGRLPDKVGTYNLSDMKDLHALYFLIPDHFLSSSDILLNPMIKTGKTGIRGDVDLYLDGCLIDIKTTKSSRLEIDMYHQVIAYYLFADCYGFGEESPQEKKPIRHAGIYFSRHGFLARIDIQALCMSSYIETIADFLHVISQYQRSK
jgi:hypothetical protein